MGLFNNMFEFLARNGSLSEWLIAVGTVGAVIISLKSTNKKPKGKISATIPTLRIGSDVITKGERGVVPMLQVTFKNIKDVPIVLDEKLLIIESIQTDEASVFDFSFYLSDIENIKKYKPFEQRTINIPIQKIIKPLYLKELKYLKIYCVYIDNYGRNYQTKKMDISMYLPLNKDILKDKKEVKHDNL